MNTKTRSLSNHKRNWNKIIINRKKNEDNYFNLTNDFYKNKQRQKVYNNIINDINNIKEIKINNYNKIYNNFYDTFRNKRIYQEKESQVFLPVNTKIKNDRIYYNDNYYLKKEESNKIFFNDSNQFFYNVFKNSVKKYPFLHLLKNKVNKMKYCQQKLKNQNNEIDKEIKKESKMSLLEKI